MSLRACVSAGESQGFNVSAKIKYSNTGNGTNNRSTEKRADARNREEDRAFLRETPWVETVYNVCTRKDHSLYA